ncbi:MAG TPA: hypothetical protein DIU15_08860, partial [Deltaproteobacteria bacterium]|nr:hypothetical protein [Deltaproteobacteria bacterium]
LWNWGKLDLYGDSPFDPNLAVHVELALRSPVLMGVVRFYVAPALFVGLRPRPIEDDPKTELNEGARWSFAGGGYYGVEFFTSPYSSFFIEVGGQGPAHKLAVDSGFNLMVGKSFQLGPKLPEDRRKRRSPRSR